MSLVLNLRVLLETARSAAVASAKALEEACDIGRRLSADMGFESRDGSRLNRAGYQKLITEDVAWLEAQPPTLERTHIKQVLLWSVSALYGRLEPRCREDGYKDGKCVNLAEDGFCRLSDCTHSLVKPPTEKRSPQVGASPPCTCRHPEDRHFETVAGKLVPSGCKVCGFHCDGFQAARHYQPPATPASEPPVPTSEWATFMRRQLADARAAKAALEVQVEEMHDDHAATIRSLQAATGAKAALEVQLADARGLVDALAQRLQSAIALLCFEKLVSEQACQADSGLISRARAALAASG